VNPTAVLSSLRRDIGDVPRWQLLLCIAGAYAVVTTVLGLLLHLIAG
jgi:hypothetical protein